MNSNRPQYLVTDTDRAVLAALQDGLPLTPQPYATIAESTGLTEREVVERIRALQQHQIIRRMGVIVHHRPLGYKANAMVVWNLPADKIEAFGNQVSQFDYVTLCYQRRPDLPVWPYTLYTMIHGQDRAAVLERVTTLVECSPLKEQTDYKVLFSNRRFKQQGARYFKPKQHNASQQTEAVAQARAVQ